MVFIIAAVLVITFGFVVFFGAPYVPSKRRQIAVALEMLEVDEDAVIIDLGAGDGVFLKAAARKGAVVHGYELNPILCVIAWLRCLKYRKRVHIHWANFWRVQLPAGTTGVYTFLLTRYMKRLDAKMQAEATRLKHPLELASFTFAIRGKQTDDVREGVFFYKYKP